MSLEKKMHGVTEAQLASIVASASDAIISTDANQRIILFNHAAEVMFQHEAAQTLGLSIGILMPERYQGAHRRYMDAFGRSGVTTRSMRSPGQLVGIRASGEEFPIEAMISHADTEEGMIYTVIIRDITERVRTEEARTEFLAMLGHELRNPLGAISNAIALARLGANGGIASRPLDLLERQVRHMTRLVNDLIDISRVTRGQIDLQPETVDLASAVDEVAQALQPHYQTRGVQLHLSFSDHALLLRADPVRLNQVLMNLMDNAAKYTGHGGDVWVEAERQDSVVVLRVRDNGMGIAPELLPRLFEPFIQGAQPPDQSHGGLGIGLALSKRIVALHSGSLQASSPGPGLGSEFVVRLPLAPDGDGPGLSDSATTSQT